MITKFHTVYPGHIDLPDRGQGTTPANERRYSNEELAGVFAKTDTVAKKLDEIGFETYWLAEHHFQHEGYECLPNILMCAVHLAHLTKSLRIGCGFNITPMWHPLRLAEDFATADILTKGRTVFGVGRGYHTREVETFGSPMMDQNANRDLFEEQVEIIFKSFKEERFSHQGKHYTLPPRVPYRGYELEHLTLVPRPVNLPVETWQPVVSANPRGLDFMVRHGIKGAVGGGAATMAEGPIQGYRDAAARAGKELELGEGLMIGIFFYIADTKEKAIAEMTPLYEEHVKMFAPLGFVPGISPRGRRGGGKAFRLVRQRGSEAPAFHGSGRMVCGNAGGAGRAPEEFGGALPRHAARQSQHPADGTDVPDAGTVRPRFRGGHAALPQLTGNPCPACRRERAPRVRRRGTGRPRTAPTTPIPAHRAVFPRHETGCRAGRRYDYPNIPCVRLSRPDRGRPHGNWNANPGDANLPRGTAEDDVSHQFATGGLKLPSGRRLPRPQGHGPSDQVLARPEQVPVRAEAALRQQPVHHARLRLEPSVGENMFDVCPFGHKRPRHQKRSVTA